MTRSNFCFFVCWRTVDVLFEDISQDFTGIYHVNHGVMQGFPALRKRNVTTHVQNTIFFHVCLISPIGCRRVTRFSRHSVGLTNERQSLNHSPQSIHAMKNPFRLQSGVQTFLEGEENQNTKIKTERYVFSCFGDGISFRLWNESFKTQKKHFRVN